jgi:rubrerythrin
MATNDNLKTAFAGESQANRKYLAFAKKAEQEGFFQVAKLFRAAADAETVHALNHFNVMKGIKATADNLKAAITGETDEFMVMYPKMIAEAEAEKNSAAKMSFSGANAVEKEHAELYKKAAMYVNKGKDMDKTDIYVCQVCGHTVEGNAPDNCPICGSPKKVFKRIE